MDINLQKFEVDLPPVADADKGEATVRRVSVVLPDASLALLAGSDAILTLDQDPAILQAQLETVEGIEATLRSLFLDAAGQPSGSVDSQAFTLIDTIPPNAPGPFGEIRLVSERTITVPDPVPPAPEPPVEP